MLNVWLAALLAARAAGNTFTATFTYTMLMNDACSLIEARDTNLQMEFLIKVGRCRWRIEPACCGTCVVLGSHGLAFLLGGVFGSLALCARHSPALLLCVCASCCADPAQTFGAVCQRQKNRVFAIVEGAVSRPEYDVRRFALPFSCAAIHGALRVLACLL